MKLGIIFTLQPLYQWKGDPVTLVKKLVDFNRFWDSGDQKRCFL
jgi:hypothetical protein